MNRRMQIFSFNPPNSLVEEGKWLTAVTSFDATNSVFKRPDENNSFSTTIPGPWSSESAEQTIDKLKKIIGTQISK